jgi:hypothetical protein
MTFADILHLVALMGGAVVAVSLYVRKPRTVEQLIAELDVTLAAKVAEVADNHSMNQTAWKDLDLWQIDRQARLLIRITIELAKLYPNEFAKLPHEQRHRLWMLRSVSLLTIAEAVYRRLGRRRESLVNAAEFARSFIAIFDATEAQIVCFDVLEKKRECVYI